MSNHNDKVTFRVRIVALVEIDGIEPTEEEKARHAFPICPSDPTRIIRKYSEAVSLDIGERRGDGEDVTLPRLMMSGGGRHRELRAAADAQRAREVLVALGAVEVGDPEEAP